MAPAGFQHALRFAARRAFATHRQLAAPQLRRAPAPSPLTAHPALRNAFRRTYTDSAQPKKKGFRLLRWLWRATYVSAIVGTGYAAYGIYEMRNPPDQVQPDPKKKTLVILGALPSAAKLPMACTDRLRQVLVGAPSPS